MYGVLLIPGKFHVILTALDEFEVGGLIESLC